MLRRSAYALALVLFGLGCGDGGGGDGGGGNGGTGPAAPAERASPPASRSAAASSRCRCGRRPPPPRSSSATPEASSCRPAPPTSREPRLPQGAARRGLFGHRPRRARAQHGQAHPRDERREQPAEAGVLFRAKAEGRLQLHHHARRDAARRLRHAPRPGRQGALSHRRQLLGVQPRGAGVAHRRLCLPLSAAPRPLRRAHRRQRAHRRRQWLCDRGREHPRHRLLRRRSTITSRRSSSSTATTSSRPSRRRTGPSATAWA